MTDELDAYTQQLQEKLLEEARALYSETVIDHWMNPRNNGTLPKPDGHARITGPCGDTMEFFLKIENRTIRQMSFLTDGCATSIASASMAVQLATGTPITDALSIEQQTILEALDGLPEESAHCALLASNTLKAAIRDHLSTAKQPWKRIYR
jgi:nitrogen fixation protein NifU and related proteins